jgi:hypothetical protein
LGVGEGATQSVFFYQFFWSSIALLFPPSLSFSFSITCFYIYIYFKSLFE